MSKRRKGALRKDAERSIQHVRQQVSDPDTEPDWDHECDNCGAKPIVPFSGMCGPCTFGEADTAGGNW